MEPLQPSTGRSARLAIVAVALLALLAVVAFASRSGLGHESQAKPTPGDYAFTALLIVLRARDSGRRLQGWIQAHEGTVQHKSFRSRVIRERPPMLFFLLHAVIVIYIKRHHGKKLFQVDTSGLKKASDAVKSSRRTCVRTTSRSSSDRVLDRNGRRARRGRRADRHAVASDARWFARPDGRRRRGAGISMSDAIEDPRGRAGCASRCDRRLRADGGGPAERLGSQRDAATCGGSCSVSPRAARRRLTLFEQAKFSRHDIDATMKQEAIDALHPRRFAERPCMRRHLLDLVILLLLRVADHRLHRARAPEHAT